MPMYDVASSAATSGLSGSRRSNRLTTRSDRNASPKYFRRPAVRWFETSVATWISGSEPSCQPEKRRAREGDGGWMSAAGATGSMTRARQD